MWIARDKDKDLYLFLAKPVRYNEDIWLCPDDCKAQYKVISLDGSLYPEVKWETEPLEVDIIRNKDFNNICLLLKSMMDLNLLNPNIIKTEKDLDFYIKLICG